MLLSLFAMPLLLRHFIIFRYHTIILMPFIFDYYYLMPIFYFAAFFSPSHFIIFVIADAATPFLSIILSHFDTLFFFHCCLIFFISIISVCMTWHYFLHIWCRHCWCRYFFHYYFHIIYLLAILFRHWDYFRYFSIYNIVSSLNNSLLSS